MRSSSFFLRAALAVLPLTHSSLEVAARKVNGKRGVILFDDTPSPTINAADIIYERQATVTPSNNWVPAPVCSQGSTNTAANGGGYTDRFGNIWDTRCSQTLSGTVVLANLGTNGQGYYGCVKACARRALCTAFTFTINTGQGQTNATAGTGTCQLRRVAGDYSVVASGTYSGAHLIRSGTGPNALPVSVHVWLHSRDSLLICYE